ncbi:tRNA 2-thiocytidine(32) synthetase TtcA [Candidatus Epulonipiscium fishelsonii]|uniref:tRNA 2-thiocytidine(32) synthetase TtcA n=1 Tax=Candidatus Epulonipiscium fishelsonii TaxID=77094 RepID=A0ACC8X9B9_9FIRM|nr:tRNA 2-thiocytidine(32) synthetase TtcA [Epulopiscium sp. SCG-B11WGA-EpuloA1]ONI39933.1 tRNA 2-thiocytidine(32) synthetase TtcA [Epulopiscium sp. SCG-B05WGA-EpuloA1]
MKKHVEVERALIKKFRKNIWSRFVKGINEYKLFNENDVIGVCISGGKDSMLLAKCMQELQKHGKQNFDIKFLVMNPGYSQSNQDLIEKNLKLLNIDATIFNSPIFDVVATVDQSPCYLCARMRRGYLYKEAQKLGCNKIALGHHFDDVIETTLMSMLYSGEIKTMMPKLHSENYPGMELIRPLYLVKEESIIRWKNYHNLEFLQCACKLTEALHLGHGQSKRQEMKELIKNFRSINSNIDINIFKSMHNINCNTILGFRKDGEYHSFLEEY